MKREELEKLGLTDKAVIDAIMESHGKDIEKHKKQVTDAETERDAIKNQLAEANTAIEGFKALKPEELQKAADDWKAKFEQGEKDHAAALIGIEFDKEFDTALAGAKVKYTNEVKSRLKIDELKDKNGKFIAERFTEQIGKIKTDAADLFSDTKEPPRIVMGGNSQPSNISALEAAVNKGGGFKT